MAIAFGGVCVGFSNAHFGHPNNMIGEKGNPGASFHVEDCASQAGHGQNGAQGGGGDSRREWA